MVANEEHNTQYKLNRIEVSMKKNQGLLSTEAHHASSRRFLLFWWNAFADGVSFSQGSSYAKSVQRAFNRPLPDQRESPPALNLKDKGP